MIRGQTRVLKTPEIKAKLNASIHNRFDIEVVDSKTGKIKQRAQAENIILDSYWSIIFSVSEIRLTYIHVGSGTDVPKATDTALGSFKQAYGPIYTLTESVYNQETGVYFGKYKTTISETELVGETLTEIGLATSSSSSSLRTKALFKDMNGNAISIAKTSTDIINIYATVFVKFDSTAMSGGVVSSAVSSTYQRALIEKAFGLTSWWSTYGKMYFIGSDGSCTKPLTYTRNGKQITFTAARIGAAEGNFSGGIKIISLGGMHGRFIDFALPNEIYLGSNIIGEVIGTGDGSTVNYATDFVYATNATIYIDGVPQSDVTVENVSSVSNNIHFVSAPPSGSVITADYHTGVVAKDANHVFDFSLTIQFGEYTGA